MRTKKTKIFVKGKMKKIFAFFAVIFLMLSTMACSQNNSEIDGVWVSSEGTEIVIGKGKIVGGNGETLSGVIISNGIIADKKTKAILAKYSFVTSQELMDPFEEAADSHLESIRSYDSVMKEQSEIWSFEYTLDTRSDEEIRNTFLEAMEQGDPQLPLVKEYQEALRRVPIADQKRLLWFDGVLLEKK